MSERSLHVEYRNGLPLAAYLYLSGRPGRRVAKTIAADDGLLIVDYDIDGQPFGVEITAPVAVPLHRLNELLVQIGETPLSEDDYRPAHAA